MLKYIHRLLPSIYSPCVIVQMWREKQTLRNNIIINSFRG